MVDIDTPSYNPNVTLLFWRCKKQFREILILEEFRKRSLEDRQAYIRRLGEFVQEKNNEKFYCVKICSAIHPSQFHVCQGGHEKDEACHPCQELVRRGEECGHPTKVPCFTAQTWVCRAPCRYVHPCGHRCDRMCYEECAVCPLSEMRIYECRHELDLPCTLKGTEDDYCRVEVDSPVKPFCGHPAKVSCGLKDRFSAYELSVACKEICNAQFLEADGGCGHFCMEKCGTCFENTFHSRCQEPCGRILICGHACSEPCSKACLPCKRPCEVSCEHRVCDKECGQPCTPCTKPCTYNCKHKSCVKLCGQKCSPGRCERSCTEKLACGHPCVGICGEACPPHCRICTPQDLLNGLFFMDDAVRKSHRFVYLEGCGHSVEVEFMDKWMATENGDGEITLKKCPHCKSTIYKSKRYQKILAANHKNVSRIKDKIYGSAGEIARLQNAAAVILLEEYGGQGRSPFERYRAYVSSLVVKADGVPCFTQLCLAEARSVFELANFWRRAQTAWVYWTENLLEVDIGPSIAMTQSWLNQISKRKIPLPQSELLLSAQEIDRQYDLGQVLARRGPHRPAGSITLLETSKGQAAIDAAYFAVFDARPYGESAKKKFAKKLRALDKAIKCKLGLTIAERREVLQAINLTSGRWFKCPNGHVYLITECGGPTEVGYCNECGLAIGGRRHALLPTNALATEMDGAMNPAYPVGPPNDLNNNLA